MATIAPSPISDRLQKEAYQQKMAAQLQLWDIRIRKLEARGTHQNVHSLRHAQGLRRKMQEAWGTLSALQQESDHNWMPLRQQTEQLWREMQQTVSGMQRVS
jgi:hypothetical protein